MSTPEVPVSERRIETEEIRDPGADFGPGILILGLALCIVLVVVLS